MFAIGSLTTFILLDFATIAFSIMASYKFYRVMEFGKHVFYPSLGIIPLSLFVSLVIVFILFLSGAYKNESSLLNVEEIKSVVKGISLSFLLFAVILVFGKLNLSRYVFFLSFVSSLLLVVIERSSRFEARRDERILFREDGVRKFQELFRRSLDINPRRWKEAEERVREYFSDVTVLIYRR